MFMSKNEISAPKISALEHKIESFNIMVGPQEIASFFRMNFLKLAAGVCIDRGKKIFWLASFSIQLSSW